MGVGGEGGCLSPNHTGVSSLLLLGVSFGITETSWPAIGCGQTWNAITSARPATEGLWDAVTSAKPATEVLGMPSPLRDQPQRDSGMALAHLFLFQVSMVNTSFKKKKNKTRAVYWSKCWAQLSPFIKNYSYYYRNGTQTNRNYPQFSIVKDHSWDWKAEANSPGILGKLHNYLQSVLMVREKMAFTTFATPDLSTVVPGRVIAGTFPLMDSGNCCEIWGYFWQFQIINSLK